MKCKKKPRNKNLETDNCVDEWQEAPVIFYLAAELFLKVMAQAKGLNPALSRQLRFMPGNQM